MSDRGRPRTRGECGDTSERPCPFVSCRHHLYLDVPRRGRLRVLYPGDVDALPETCALDVADGGAHSLREVGALWGVSANRIQQIELQALEKVRRALARTSGASIRRELLLALGREVA